MNNQKGLQLKLQLSPDTAAGEGTHQTALGFCEGLGNTLPTCVQPWDFFPMKCDAPILSSLPQTGGEHRGKEQFGWQHLITVWEIRTCSSINPAFLFFRDWLVWAKILLDGEQTLRAKSCSWFHHNKSWIVPLSSGYPVNTWQHHPEQNPVLHSRQLQDHHFSWKLFYNHSPINKALNPLNLQAIS